MANNLMSGTLSTIIKEQVMTAISKGDTALANAWGKKKIDDCVSAIYDAFYTLAKDAHSSGVALNGDDALIGSAAIHWYTEDKPTKESLVDILKGGTEVLKMQKPTTDTPKADKPKKESKPKAETPKASKPTMAIVPTPKPAVPVAPVPQVEDDDDEWLE